MLAGGDLHLNLKRGFIGGSPDAPFGNEMPEVHSIFFFFFHSDIQDPVLILIVGSTGLAVNLFGMVIFAGSGHGHSHGGGGGSHGAHGSHGGHGSHGKAQHDDEDDHDDDHHGHDHGHNHGHNKGKKTVSSSSPPATMSDSRANSVGSLNTEMSPLQASNTSASDDSGLRHAPSLHHVDGDVPASQYADPSDAETSQARSIIQLQIGKTYTSRKNYTATKAGYLTLAKGDSLLIKESVKSNVYLAVRNGTEEGRVNARYVKIPTGGQADLSQEELATMREVETTQLKYPVGEVTSEPDLEQGLPKEVAKKTYKGGHNMRAVFLHVLGDALGSIGVIFASLMIWLTPFSWRFYVDPIVSLFITAIIIYGTVPLIKETALVLLQGVPDFDFAGLRKDLRETNGVRGVHEVHVWRLADNKLVGSAHLLVADFREGIAISAKAKEIFHQYDIHSSTIQTEYVSAVPSDSETDGDVDETTDTACLLSCDKDCDEQGCCAKEGETTVKTPTSGKSSSSH